MALHRPYIPIAVRIEVARRQALALRSMPRISQGTPALVELSTILNALFPGERCHLDHLPALALRKFNPRTKRYTPDANDPNYLLYRSTHAHHIKTNVRGDGAQHPDRVLIKRERRRKRPIKKTSRKKWPPSRKIPSRPFPRRIK